MSIRLEHGDCREVVKLLADCSIDSCVTDPPYSLVSIQKRFGKPGSAPAQEGRDGLYRRASAGFMGQQWDTGETAFDPEWWREVYRVLKPGAHLVAFSGTRTYHRMACAIEDAGFEIRDQLAWAYGSGFPKSHDVAKGIDKAAGVEREVIGEHPLSARKPNGTWTGEVYEGGPGMAGPTLTAPATDAARQWSGWGTAIKPAWEPICLARKPLVGTVAQNVLAHGTGAINIDGCRIPVNDDEYARNCSGDRGHNNNRKRDMDFGMTAGSASTIGRWPANVVHDGSPEVVAAFAQYGERGAFAPATGREDSLINGVYGARKRPSTSAFHADTGSAARFFFSAKADADDRWGSKHPTVKPVDLMRWLARLITPPGGLVLDPFAGSGTTGVACLSEGFRAILIEREAEYIADIKARLDHYAGKGGHSLSVRQRNADPKKATGADTPLFSGLR